MHPSSSNQHHSEATTKGHAQRARGAMYAPVDPFKPSVALGVKKILGKAKDRTIDDIPVDRAGGGGGRERKENGLATRPSNEHPYSPNNAHYRPAVPPPPPLQNWYPNVPGSVQAPYGYGGYLAPNPTWTSPYGQYAPDNTWAPQGSTGGWGQRPTNGPGDWAGGAGWGQGDVDPAWSGWNADTNNVDWGLLGGGGEWGLPEGGITGGWATFGSGDTRVGEGHASKAWGSGNIEGLDELWGGESIAGVGGGLYAPPKEPAGQREPARRTNSGEKGADEEDIDDGRGIANVSFFQLNNSVERAPASPQAAPSSSDDAAPMEPRSSPVPEQRLPRRVRYSSSTSNNYIPPSAPQPSRISPRSNALPLESSPFGLFETHSLNSRNRSEDANAPRGAKSCSRCHTTSTPLWRVDRTTDEPLCEACYMKSDNEVKQPVSSTSSQAPSSTKHCSKCKTTTTSRWRRDPTTFAPLCNACNMVEVLKREEARLGTPYRAKEQDSEGSVCSHCGTGAASVWRRTSAGDVLCNACGTYLRLRGKPRPLTLARNAIESPPNHDDTVPQTAVNQLLSSSTDSIDITTLLSPQENLKLGSLESEPYSVSQPASQRSAPRPLPPLPPTGPRPMPRVNSTAVTPSSNGLGTAYDADDTQDALPSYRLWREDDDVFQMKRHKAAEEYRPRDALQAVVEGSEGADTHWTSASDEKSHLRSYGQARMERSAVVEDASGRVFGDTTAGLQGLDSAEKPRLACRRCKSLKLRCERPSGGSCKRCLNGGHACDIPNPGEQAWLVSEHGVQTGLSHPIISQNSIHQGPSQQASDTEKIGSEGTTVVHEKFEPLRRPPNYPAEDPWVEDSTTSLDESDTTWIAITLSLFLDVVPRQVYLHLLLRFPALYFSRVTRIFQDANLGMGEIKRMALEAVESDLDGERSRGKNGESSINRMLVYQGFFPQEHTGAPVSYINLRNSWQGFIDSLMREWKTLNIISVLLLSAILTILQIEAAAANPLTRFSALLSLVCAFMSLLYGCLYIIRFGTMRKTHKAAEWANESERSSTSIFWNVWVMLAMPAVWLGWSMILYLVCVMSFVWQTGTVSDRAPASLLASDVEVLVPRIVISAVLGLGFVYLVLIALTFRRYSDPMEVAWQERIRGWLAEKAAESSGYSPQCASNDVDQKMEKPISSSAKQDAIGTTQPPAMASYGTASYPDRKVPVGERPAHDIGIQKLVETPKPSTVEPTLAKGIQSHDKRLQKPKADPRPPSITIQPPTPSNPPFRGALIAPKTASPPKETRPFAEENMSMRSLQPPEKPAAPSSLHLPPSLWNPFTSLVQLPPHDLPEVTDNVENREKDPGIKAATQPSKDEDHGESSPRLSMKILAEAPDDEVGSEAMEEVIRFDGTPIRLPCDPEDPPSRIAHVPIPYRLLDGGMSNESWDSFCKELDFCTTWPNSKVHVELVRCIERWNFRFSEFNKFAALIAIVPKQQPLAPGETFSLTGYGVWVGSSQPPAINLNAPEGTAMVHWHRPADDCMTIPFLKSLPRIVIQQGPGLGRSPGGSGMVMC